MEIDIEKSRKYLKRGEKAPKGVRILVSKKGNRYYIPEKRKLKVKPEKKKKPKKVKVNIRYYRKDTGEWVTKPVWTTPEKAKRLRSKGYKPRKRGEEAELLQPEDPIREHKHKVDEDEKIRIERKTPKGKKKKYIYEKVKIKHPVGLKHGSDIVDSYHRDEILNYENKYFTSDAEKDSWINKLGIKFEPNISKNPSIDTDGYYHPKTGNVYFSTIGIKSFVHAPELNIRRSFDKDADAREYIKKLFEDRLQKSMILSKIDTLLQKDQIINRVQTLLSSPQTATKEIIYSNYKSGNNEIELQGDGNNYLIRENSANVLTTSDFREAIAKYYRCMANLVQQQESDANIQLDTFGEKVILNNRIAIEKLSQMGQEEEAKLLKNFDYSGLEYFFQNAKEFNIFQDYEPTGHVFEILPEQQDLNVGAAEGGKIPRKLELRTSDNKKKKGSDEEQEVIEEKPIKYISPAIIAKDGLQGFAPFAPEEAQQDRGKEIEQPVSVEEDYQRKIKNKYQEPINQKDFKKIVEGEQAHELIPLENKEKIGLMQRPIIGKAAFGPMAPRENIGSKPEPIEIDDKFNKEKTYISSREEAPKGSNIKQGPRGGMYYEDKIESPNEYDEDNLDEVRKIGEKIGVDFNKVDVNELARGIQVEFEHEDLIGKDPILSAKIALKHLEEFPDYYTRLKKMENA